MSALTSTTYFESAAFAAYLDKRITAALPRHPQALSSADTNPRAYCFKHGYNSHSSVECRLMASKPEYTAAMKTASSHTDVINGSTQGLWRVGHEAKILDRNLKNLHLRPKALSSSAPPESQLACADTGSSHILLRERDALHLSNVCHNSPIRVLLPNGDTRRSLAAPFASNTHDPYISGWNLGKFAYKDIWVVQQWVCRHLHQ